MGATTKERSKGRARAGRQVCATTKKARVRQTRRTARTVSITDAATPATTTHPTLFTSSTQGTINTKSDGLLRPNPSDF